MSAVLSSGIAQLVQVYIKNTIVWIEDEDEAWVPASVFSKEESATGVKIVLQNELGRVKCFCENLTNVY